MRAPFRSGRKAIRLAIADLACSATASATCWAVELQRAFKFSIAWGSLLERGCWRPDELIRSFAIVRLFEYFDLLAHPGPVTLLGAWSALLNQPVPVDAALIESACAEPSFPHKEPFEFPAESRNANRTLRMTIEVRSFDRLRNQIQSGGQSVRCSTPAADDRADLYMSLTFWDWACGTEQAETNLEMTRGKDVDRCSVATRTVPAPFRQPYRRCCLLRAPESLFPQNPSDANLILTTVIKDHDMAGLTSRGTTTFCGRVGHWPPVHDGDLLKAKRLALADDFLEIRPACTRSQGRQPYARRRRRRGLCWD